MLVLAFVWLALRIVELLWGESPWFEIIGTTIWVIWPGRAAACDWSASSAR